MPSVLVTDSSERAALAVIRSLGKKGIKVIAADTASFNAGILSKYCAYKITYPSPLKNKRNFINSLLHLVKNVKIDLLIPITDFTMMPILERKEEFEEHTEVAAPSYEIAMKAYDKFQTVSVAQRCGIPHPKTFLIGNIEALREVADELNYPVVIKPRMKFFWKQEKAVMVKVTPNNYAYDKKDLLSKYMRLVNKLNEFIPPDFFIVQEYVRGAGYGVEVLMNDSNVVALFVHKRLHEYPTTGGASTLRISTWNKKLVEYSVKLLREMNWQGVAMVEFKLNEESGEVNLMEVNGRFWGSLPLAINSGVDFPYLLYKIMVEREDIPIPKYKLGFIQRWLIPGDLLWLFDSLIKIHGNSKFEVLKQFLTFSLIPDDVLSLDDFLPTIGVLADVFRYFSEVSKGKRTIYGEVSVPKSNLIF
jgi:predicted ATP-grasp superfamily ATP-dependent carboligase